MPTDNVINRLPPPELWPDRTLERAGLRYGETLNVADELLRPHLEAGRTDRPAVIAGSRRLSYGDLQDLVDRVAAGLRGQGVEPGDRVVLRMPNQIEFVASWLAVQQIGAVAVSTMPMLKARELAYVIDDCEPRLAIVSSALLPEFELAGERAKMRPGVVRVGAASGGVDSTLSFETLASASPARHEVYPTPRDALAVIAYTSGSTGAPKGACHSPVDILASADTYGRRVLMPSPSDVFGGHPTLAFTFGLGGLLVFPLRAGSATVLLERFSPDRMLEVVAQEHISVLFCAATSYKLFLQIPDLEDRHDFSSLRVCVSAGEPLPRPVYDEWIARTGVEVLDSLGTTEMFHVFVCQQIGRVRPGATGLPVPGYDARIVNDRLEEQPRGTPGLLAVRGPTGCRYWGKSDRQREYVRDGWNIPNDICVQDEDGYFWYQCRNDDLIICAGYNIAGPEVEAVLLEHPDVLEVAVVASPDPTKGSVPKAFVVLKPSVDPSDALAVAFQNLVKAQLAPYKYPRKIEFVDSLPKTETGKIRRVELRERERAIGASD